jgi:FkbM family methyltransferase
MQLMSRVLNRIDAYGIYCRHRSLLSHYPKTLLRLGSNYGGWTVPGESIRPGAIAVCAGAGEDISFDVELNRRGMYVYIVDPTPRAKVHFERVSVALASSPDPDATGLPYDLNGVEPAHFHFVDKGLWCREEILKFYAPDNDAHVSHSVKNLGGTDKYFEAECVTLSNLCKTYDLPEVSIMKMDIEGAESEVIDDICNGDVFPSVLCVEFDEAAIRRSGSALSRLRQGINKLLACGYKLVKIDNFWNFTFSRI